MIFQPVNTALPVANISCHSTAILLLHCLFSNIVAVCLLVGTRGLLEGLQYSECLNRIVRYRNCCLIVWESRVAAIVAVIARRVCEVVHTLVVRHGKVRCCLNMQY
jgi:hypothetical protein